MQRIPNIAATAEPDPVKGRPPVRVTVVGVVLCASVVEVVVCGTVVDVVVCGTVVEVEVDVLVEVDELGAVVDVVVVPCVPMQNTTWLMTGAWPPPLSGGCNALPLV